MLIFSCDVDRRHVWNLMLSYKINPKALSCAFVARLVTEHSFIF